jgi:hypothetical protein
MQIEEWQPTPPNAPPPEPPRRQRPVLIVTLLMASVFVATLAVLNWHNLTAPAEPGAVIADATKPIRPVQTQAATSRPPARELSAQAAENLTTIAECIPDSVLASQDRDRVIKMLLEKAKSADPTVMAAFDGPVDMQAVTSVQASGFMSILSGVQEPPADRAQQQQGFLRGMQDGTCKIAPPVLTQVQPASPAS